MWAVSKLLLQEGVQRSILEALRQNLRLTDPEDVKGLRRGIRKTFRHLQDEAVRVDRPGAEDGGGVIAIRFTKRGMREKGEEDEVDGDVRDMLRKDLSM